MAGHTDGQGFATRALHAEGHHKPFNAHAQPIFQTSTFYFDSPEHGADLFAGRGEGHIYTRIGNPTVEAAERVMASLEGTDAAVLFGSGMAAVTGLVLAFLNHGDHVVSGDTMYGPVVHLYNDVFKRFGIEVTLLDSSDLDAVRAAMRPNTKLVYFETPANPTCRISDIQELAKIAKEHGALSAVDSTFTTPYITRPVELGADMVMHSITKFLGGHGDVIGGVVAGRKELMDTVRTFRKDTGAVLAPFDSYLLLRGLRSLPLRMEKHCENANRVAAWLRDHPKVSHVYFPGFEEFPGHAVAKKQMREGCFGATFSFDLKGGFEAGKELMKRVKMITLAVSLGTIDSLIQHPASMTHAGVPKEIMQQQGLTMEMVRIAVGCEDVEDIIADLDQALAGIPG